MELADHDKAEGSRSKDYHLHARNVLQHAASQRRDTRLEPKEICALLALVIFWDVFILEHWNGHVKEGNADCYIRDANGTYTLVNFSKTELRERRETIDCYALALDFPKALAEVAGILFLASNGFALLTFLCC